MANQPSPTAVPVYNFAETHYIDASLVTGAYKAVLFYLTGTVNNGPFRGRHGRLVAVDGR